MQRLAIYGKGGVGKSVIATNLSVCFAQKGRKVLHVGCDPKHDSAMRLMERDGEVQTVLEQLGENPSAVTVEDIINRGRLGIECCESGGPSPGVGCAGRGVARTLEFLEERDIFVSRGYDLVMFDVLGDVVCGGFAAPLRAGFAEKVFVATSEEPMSLYAANNICKAVCTYESNGIVLGGLIVNLRENSADRDDLETFAALINTRVLAYVPRDPGIIEAENKGATLVEYDPRSETSQVFQGLADRVLEIVPKTCELPTPLSDDEFMRFVRG